MSEKKTLKQEYTERLRKYERELSLKLRSNGNNLMACGVFRWPLPCLLWQVVLVCITSMTR
jgi:hypothetical protein